MCNNNIIKDTNVCISTFKIIFNIVFVTTYETAFVLLLDLSFIYAKMYLCIILYFGLCPLGLNKRR